MTVCRLGDLSQVMSPKKIIVIVVAALFAGLMIWANTDDGAGEKTTDSAADQPTSLQKDLPSEEKIPTHIRILS